MFSFIIMVGLLIIECSGVTGQCHPIDVATLSSLREIVPFETVVEFTGFAIYRFIKKNK